MGRATAPNGLERYLSLLSQRTLASAEAWIQKK